jgi:predicted DNA-binding transcriptional regulator YafY
MFTAAEALGLVMAVLEGHGAADPADPAGSAVSKIIRVLPEQVARPADAVRSMSARSPETGTASPDLETTAVLVQACASRRRLRLGYRLEPGRERAMDVDPWAVVVRHGRWYLLCWSHPQNARRVLRVDRVIAAEVLAGTFTPPADLDPARALEQHLSEGWKYQVEVVIDAPAEAVARWLPRSLGHLEALGSGRSRLVATTDEPDWYARQLTSIAAPFRVIKPPELREAAAVLGRRFVRAARESGRR